MKATVTKPFKGVKAGEVYPAQFVVGDTVDGKLGQIAVDNEWAVSDEAGNKPAVVAEPAPVSEPTVVTEPTPTPRARRGRKS
jgi:hypothetical protein